MSVHLLVNGGRRIFLNTKKNNSPGEIINSLQHITVHFIYQFVYSTSESYPSDDKVLKDD